MSLCFPYNRNRTCLYMHVDFSALLKYDKEKERNGWMNECMNESIMKSVWFHICKPFSNIFFWRFEYTKGKWIFVNALKLIC